MLMHVLCVTTLQSQEIRVGEPVVVARAADQRFLAEPILAVHPAHPNHLLGAAMVEAAGASFEERGWQRCLVCLRTPSFTVNHLNLAAGFRF